MDEVLKDWNRLSLTQDEGARVNLDNNKEEVNKEYILAARFLARRVLNVEAIGRTFKPLWKAHNGFQIRVIGSHTILFVFEVESDAERVIAMELWTFDKHLVLLQKYDGSCPIRNLKFLKAKFWIQLHSLPVNKLNWKTAIEIGRSVGEVSYSEQKGEMIGGNFLRVRVEVDVSKPLYRG
ncbi:uncharacterized protein LOC126721434 [Quercus robur]|uniref:uncharacterized protein LOC126721434 n=1 Tax=Quercus robur TaxID=38942 RepID=UPI002163627C|nr:uncharacterized protein LOC126721434 [Quercus robur]